jgi:hypothetical protein
MDAGLIAPRPGSNLRSNLAPRREFVARLGLPTPARADRLWTLAADAPEWGVLCGKLWYRGYVSIQAIDQARSVVTQITAVREEIADALARDATGGRRHVIG